MKRLLLVLAASAGVAQAQSQVVIYGGMDIGLIKKTDTTMKMGRGDNNYLGFKGTEDLGGGLSALFQLEQRFEPDTGGLENGVRPLWQGQTRVGLSGPFGTIRLGRGLTVAQETVGGFDAFTGNRTVGSMFGFQVAGFTSEPYEAGSAGNRVGNTIFYHSPNLNGFNVNAQLTTKEGMGTSPAILPSNPYSLAFRYAQGLIAGAIAFERNPREDQFMTMSGSYNFGVAQAYGTYAKQNPATGNSTSSWQIAGNIPVGLGAVKVAYGQKKTVSLDSDSKFAVGYWHKLSKRTYLYTDVARNQIGASNSTASNYDNTQFDIGMHHTF